MKAKRKAWWLLVPAAGVVGAFLLPTPDEFAFLKGGTPVPVADFRESKDDWRATYPLRGSRERAWSFRGSADAVEAEIGRELTSGRGWQQTGRMTFFDHPGMGKDWVGRTSRLYENVDTGGVAIFVRYEKPGKGPTCAVIAREPRNAWGRIKHLGRRMVAR